MDGVDLAGDRGRVQVVVDGGEPVGFRAGEGAAGQEAGVRGGGFVIDPLLAAGAGFLSCLGVSGPSWAALCRIYSTMIGLKTHPVLTNDE